MSLRVSYKKASLKSLKKGIGSGSINQRYGSADPDPHQNVTDPQHCFGPCRTWRRLTWGRCSRCRWGRPCASRVGSGSRSIGQRYLRTRTKTSRIPNTLPYFMPEFGGGDDKYRPEDAALVVCEGVPVHLELDPDPDLLVRGTDPHQNVTDTQNTALFHAWRGGGNDKDWPKDAALVVGEGVPVHPGEPEPGEGEEGAHQAAPRRNAQLAYQLRGRTWSIFAFKENTKLYAQSQTDYGSAKLTWIQIRKRIALFFYDQMLQESVMLFHIQLKV